MDIASFRLHSCVEQLVGKLRGISWGFVVQLVQLWANYDAAKFTSAGIYPEIWDEPADELEEEYVDSFEMLKEFVAQVAESGDSLRIVLE